jgi:hypothetical protein
VLILGPLFTTKTLKSYFSALDTLKIYNLTLKWLQYDLPGTFRNNPYPATINGSLWSLFYEAACCGLVVAIGMLRITAHQLHFAVFLGVYSVAYLGLTLIDFHDNALIANFHDGYSLGRCHVWHVQIVLTTAIGATTMANSYTDREGHAELAPEKQRLQM